MKATRLSCTLALGLLSSNGYTLAQVKTVYQDEKAPVSERVHDLIGRMSLEEKVAQLESMWQFSLLGPSMPKIVEGTGINAALAKQTLGSGIGTFLFANDFLGTGGSPRDGATNRNLLQKWMLENPRLV